MIGVQVTCSAANISQLPRGLPSSVVFLDLTSNRIASLEAGSLGQLPELLHLRMRTNSLESIADGTFRNLPQLQTLDLGDNRFVLLVNFINAVGHLAKAVFKPHEN